MPLSIRGHAAHKRIMACNHAFSAWRKTKGQTGIFKGLCCVPRLFFSLHTKTRGCVSGALILFLVSTFSKSECWLSLPCQVHLSVMSGRLRQNPAPVTFYQRAFDLPHFTPKRRHSDLFSRLRLNISTTLQKTLYKVKAHYYSVLISLRHVCC